MVKFSDLIQLPLVDWFVAFLNEFLHQFPSHLDRRVPFALHFYSMVGHALRSWVRSQCFGFSPFHQRFGRIRPRRTSRWWTTAICGLLKFCGITHFVSSLGSCVGGATAIAFREHLETSLARCFSHPPSDSQWRHIPVRAKSLEHLLKSGCIQSGCPHSFNGTVSSQRPGETADKASNMFSVSLMVRRGWCSWLFCVSDDAVTRR